MPTWSSFGAFERDLARLSRDLDQREARRITKMMAEKGQEIAERAASADLGGDPKFSGWAPTLDTQVKSKSNGQTWLLPTRSSAGPWTVAERGRNVGETGRFLGPGINVRTGQTRRRKDGTVARQRNRRAKRWNGVTAGKNTATDAVREMDRQLPKIAEGEVRRALRGRFDVR